MVALSQSFTIPLFPEQGRATDSDVQVAEGRRLDHSLWARRDPKVRLTVSELTCDGASGTSDVPLIHGEHLAIKFPARWGRPAWTGFGRVVKCEADDEGYAIVIDFDPLPAA